MKLIVGLGNPGKKYEKNRHNVGYMVVDALKRRNLPKNVVVAKTSVFMNESGRAVKKLITNYHLPITNLYIIHDDLDIPLGKFKIQKGKGPKDHKGVESVDKALGTREYWHVRVGVDNRNPENRTPGEEYVLQDFLPKERKVIEKVVVQIAEELVKKIK